MSTEVYIGAGSNIDADTNLRKALESLIPRTNVTGVSIFYRSPAVGRPEQASFTNGVLRACWDGTAAELKFDVLRDIESRLGRSRGPDRYADRPIDLDLLFFGQQVIHADDLTVPDTEILERPYIYVPLLELAPEIVLPGNGRLAQQVSGPLLPGMKKLQPAARLTEQLRAVWRHSMGRRGFQDPD